MKANEKIKKLKEGCYIEYSKIGYTTKIYLKDKEDNLICIMTQKEFDSLKKLNKNMLKLIKIDDSDLITTNKTIQREIKTYVYNY